MPVLSEVAQQNGQPAAGGSLAADPVTHFLLAIAVIVIVCNLLAWLARKLGQPAVVGEIIGGLLLGPSVLAHLWPGGSAWLLPSSVVTTLNAVAQLGLVTFMFLLGSELRLSRAGAPAKTVGAVALGSITLPFAGGIALAIMGKPLLAGPTAPSTAYLLAFGLAMAITALPVLARILTDTRMDKTPVGTLSLAAAAVGDGTAWLALTIILAASGLTGTGGVLLTAGMVAALVLVTFVVVRPLLAALLRRATGNAMVQAALVSGAIGYAALTQFIGLHAAIGAFLFGVVLPRDSAIVRAARERLRGFTETVLLPLFFAGVGLSTTVDVLGGSPAAWLLLVAVVLVATVTKLCGASVGARVTGLPWHASLQIGVLMNCRGVTELIIATICLQYGLISQTGFTILVLMALITTMSTGPLIRLLTKARKPARNDSRSVEEDARRKRYIGVNEPQPSRVGPGRTPMSPDKEPV
jgi:Kef-type K+ transport system membrane component KefB